MRSPLQILSESSATTFWLRHWSLQWSMTESLRRISLGRIGYIVSRERSSGLALTSCVSRRWRKSQSYMPSCSLKVTMDRSRESPTRLGKMALVHTMTRSASLF